MQERDLAPQELLVDFFYGSEGSRGKAKALDLEVVPVCANVGEPEKGEKIPLSDFIFTEKGKLFRPVELRLLPCAAQVLMFPRSDALNAEEK